MRRARTQRRAECVAVVRRRARIFCALVDCRAAYCRTRQSCGVEERYLFLTVRRSAKWRRSNEFFGRRINKPPGRLVSKLRTRRILPPPRFRFPDGRVAFRRRFVEKTQRRPHWWLCEPRSVKVAHSIGSRTSARKPHHPPQPVLS